MSNENNQGIYCPKCHLRIAGTQERKYKDTPFHTRCIAVLRARASIANYPVEIVIWNGRDSRKLLIEPEAQLQVSHNF